MPSRGGGGRGVGRGKEWGVGDDTRRPRRTHLRDRNFRGDR